MTLKEECALRKKARKEGWLDHLDNPRIPRRRKLSKKEAFLRSKEWKQTRRIALGYYGSRCMKCGSTDQIQIDHIKPRSKYPGLSLDVMNLQVLCWPCNKKKNNIDIMDYRFIQAGKNGN